ncbi:glycoside hydrolase family 3 C-terminal domain-containing protein [Natronoflexus pectinivorans]|uniref:Beta-glucosidase n=1 Tax=Natronoflexus pectinivorans TaxID=682526 RepID=A0A4R2GLU3_9BACT|nr:glycoside hydrolase family 3 C-terminal domain-containing protein [Natronoflexus pectinivorans]TCO09710.1 beta-glucosidase [Natronoflexus pectinivorans]
MKYTLMTVKAVLFGLVMSISAQEIPIYLDDSFPIEERVEDALSRLTTQEKVALLHAQSKFSSAGVARLGIPEVWMTDGPHGIRPEVLWDEWSQAEWTNDSCIAFPALTALAATWNLEMSRKYGEAIGAEARYRKKTVLLGPGVNIYRTPLNGRNFEYMGEDPFLASKMVVPYIQGVQSNGVAACVKHFAVNNQEVERGTIDVQVDERTLREIYLPAFKAAVQEGNVWAIMGAYNKFRGEHCCHNDYLLNKILREEWGFDGVVVSDWGGVHDTREAIFKGLDMEFGTWTDGLSWGASNAYANYYLAQPYLKLIKSGEVGTEELDAKARNVLRLIFRTEMDRNRPFGSFGTEEHGMIAREIAQEGIVLLKNDGNILPINPGRTNRIAVIGENAIKMMTVGGGSSSLKAKYEISPLDGLRQRLEPNVEVVYARGYVGDVGGTYNNVSTGQDLNDDRSEEELMAEAIQVAQEADYVIFIGGLNKSEHQDSEGTDRLSMDLPYNQDVLIAELAKVNANFVVVNVSGNAVTMPWINDTPAVVQSWYLGSETGTALAAILVGDVNPSGKLPFSYPVKLSDNSAHAFGEYPGSNGVVRYNEGLLVGYRWHDKMSVEPLFSFGHGLSYTTFAYGKAQLSDKTLLRDGKITCSVAITNTGDRAGSEIVQLYISDKKSSLPRPVKELKGFKKVKVEPGETVVVDFLIDVSLLQFYDDRKSQWVAESGKFDVLIGASSSDIQTTTSFTLK